MFHVPTTGRNTTHPWLATDARDGNNGAFDVDSPEPGWRLMLLCSDGGGWEHVSIHAYRESTGGQRTPNWREMAYIKRLCWDANDVAMQIYPKESDYVNCHPHTLHWWRPIGVEIPTPPPEFVGPGPAPTTEGSGS